MSQLIENYYQAFLSFEEGPRVVLRFPKDDEWTKENLAHLEQLVNRQVRLLRVKAPEDPELQAWKKAVAEGNTQLSFNDWATPWDCSQV